MFPIFRYNRIKLEDLSGVKVYMNDYFAQIIQLNHISESDFFRAVRQDIRGIALRSICEYMKESPEHDLAVRKIYHATEDNLEAAHKTLRLVCGCELPPEDLEWLNSCLCARFHKKPRRKVFSAEEKHAIWLQGGGTCAICEAPVVDGKFDVDHKIPWDYVGDELANNYQPLCRKCNLEKSKKTVTALENMIFFKGGKQA